MATHPLVQQMIDIGVLGDKESSYARQLQRAQALQMFPMPQGMRVGGTYRAASPLEHLASAANRISGARQAREAEQGLAGITEQRRDARGAYVDAMLAGQQPSVAPAAQEAPPWSPPDLVTQQPSPPMVEAMQPPQPQKAPELPLPILGAISGDPMIAGLGNAVQQQQIAQQRAASEAERRQQDEAFRQAQLAETRRSNMAGEQSRADRLALDKQRLEADRVAAGQEGARGRQEAGKVAADLRKEFNGLPVVKKTQEVAEAYSKIVSASPNGVGDVSLLVGFMKLIDPGSTVREGEFATAEQTPGAAKQYLNLYNKLIAGDRLPEEARTNFKAEARRLLEAQLQNYSATADYYKRYAEQAGLAPDDVVMDLGYQRLVTPQGPGAGGVITLSVDPVKADAEYEALPAGAQFIAPDGSLRRKE